MSDPSQEPTSPEELAELKAESRRRRRQAQTPINLVVALIASLGIVLFLVFVVVRPDPGDPEPIDFRAIEVDASAAVGTQLAAPQVPATWVCNRADLQSVDGISTWYVGFVTSETGYVALEQGVEADATWLANRVGSARADGERTIDGITWQVYDRRDDPDAGNLAFALSAEFEGSTVVLRGTAPDEEFDALASLVAGELSTEEEAP